MEWAAVTYSSDSESRVALLSIPEDCVGGATWDETRSVNGDDSGGFGICTYAFATG